MPLPWLWPLGAGVPRLLLHPVCSHRLAGMRYCIVVHLPKWAAPCAPPPLQFSDALRELQKTAQYGSTISQAEFS